MADQPLTDKQLAFARAYAGDGIRACQAAGYTGSNAVLSSRAWKLLQDPRIVAIIEARRTGEAPAQPPSRPTTADDETDLDAADFERAPLEILRALANDSTVLGSTRSQAAIYLDKREREERAAEAGSTLERAQAAINAALRAKRQREREDREHGVCTACGGPVNALGRHRP